MPADVEGQGPRGDMGVCKGNSIPGLLQESCCPWDLPQATPLPAPVHPEICPRLPHPLAELSHPLTQL